MENSLLKEALAKYITGLVIFLLVLFVPAGTLHYWQGWLLTALLFAPMLLVGILLLRKNPALLRRRLNDKETESQQKQVVLMCMGMFLAAFILAGLHVRFGWRLLPAWVSWTASVVFLIGYALYAEVIRENAYLSRVVEVQKDQKVVDTGLYGLVRHPMYMATLLLFLAMPLVLGCAVSFLIMLLYIPVIMKRIRNEEQVLEQGLAGYREYREKVRYRLIPFLW